MNPGHKSDFKYSEAMLTRKASGVLWNEEELYRYLYALSNMLLVQKWRLLV